MLKWMPAEVVGFGTNSGCESGGYSRWKHRSKSRRYADSGAKSQRLNELPFWTMRLLRILARVIMEEKTEPVLWHFVLILCCNFGISYGYQFQSKMIHFQSSSLLKPWGKQQMAQIHGPLYLCGNHAWWSSGFSLAIMTTWEVNQREHGISLSHVRALCLFLLNSGFQIKKN